MLTCYAAFIIAASFTFQRYFRYYALIARPLVSAIIPLLSLPIYFGCQLPPLRIFFSLPADCFLRRFRWLRSRFTRRLSLRLARHAVSLTPIDAGFRLSFSEYWPFSP